MSRRLLPLAALLLPAGAQAADRTVYIGSFDRIRVQGPYEVTVAAGASPAARVSGPAAAVEQVEVRVDGTSLVVRPVVGAFRDRPLAGGGEPVRVELVTPRLTAATVTGASRLKVGAMRGDRVDLTVTGAGAIEAGGIDTPRLAATVLGSGTIAAAGKAGAARLASNGTGSIDAGGLDAGELTVRLEGTGEVRASARYQAQVNNTGVGRVTVAGHPKCQVAASASGPVVCGAGAP